MAWSSPSTRTTGTLITAAIWNQDVVDNPTDLDNRNHGLAHNQQQNVVINGYFDIWQRGTSFAAIASGAYFADRWVYRKNGSMVHTAQRFTGGPNASQFSSEGIDYLHNIYAAQLVCTTADASIGAGEYVFIEQTIEGYEWRRLYGRPFTLSFWAYAIKAGTYSVAIRNSSANLSCLQEFTLAGSTWTYVTLQFPAITTGTWSFANSIGAYLDFTVAAGTTYQNATTNSWLSGNYLATTNQVNGVDNTANTFYIAQVTLLPSSVDPYSAIPSYQEELKRCLRYFWRNSGGDLGGSALTAASVLGWGMRTASPGGDYVSSFYSPVPMRASPTISIAGNVYWANSGGLSNVISTLTSTGVNGCSITAETTFSGGSGGLGSGAYLTSYVINTDDTNYVQFNAEL